MKQHKITALLAATVLTLSTPLCAQTLSLRGEEVTSSEYNGYTYIDYVVLHLADVSIENQLCVPLEGRLVFAMPKDNKWYLPVRALGSNYNYKWQDGKLVITEAAYPKDTPSGYVHTTYDKLENLTDKDFQVTLSTSYWDTTTNSLKTREDIVALKALEKRTLKVFPYTVNREVISIKDAQGNIISHKEGTSYIDESAIKSYFKEKNRTIFDVFPEYYPEYTVKATGEIVKVTNKAQGTCTVLHDDGTVNKMSSSALTMRRANRINQERVTNEQIIEFITKKGYTSPTDYLVFTDLSRQYTHILKKSGNSWVVIKSLLSSTGLNETPTPTGVYHLTKKVPYFGVEKGYRCKNAVGFIGGTYLYHSTIFDKTGSYLLEGKGVLGTQASQGCVRFTPEEAKWFYDTLPLNSTVVIR